MGGLDPHERALFPSYADVFVGAPLFMDRGSDGKLQEVGQVSVSLQKASGDFQTTKLNGFEVFARFGSAIAPLGDLDQDGFNGKGLVCRGQLEKFCPRDNLLPGADAGENDRHPRFNAKVLFSLRNRSQHFKNRCPCAAIRAARVDGVQPLPWPVSRECPLLATMGTSAN